MRLSKKQQQEILEKIKKLPQTYWEKRFEKIQANHDEATEDLMNEIKYLFSLTQEQILTLIAAYIAKYGEDNEVDYYQNLIPITRSELREIKDDLDILTAQLILEGLDFDKDIKKQIKDLSTKTTRIDGMKLRIRAKVFYLYSIVNKRVYDYMGSTAEDSYYRSVYEVYKAAGYGKERKDLEDLTLATLLAEVWRSTGETFDDAIWRYGRSFGGELNNLFGRLIATPKIDVSDVQAQLLKKFKTKQNELNRNIITDTTFFETRGFQEGYVTLEVNEVIYTAIQDEKTCETCGSLDGTVIPVDSIVPFENAPPIHSNCRCVLVGVITAVNWLTGEVHEIEDTFDEWYGDD